MATMTMDAASSGISIEQVAKRYDGARPVQALQDVSLAVPPGQFVAILGPSGCGKSTLLNMLAGFETPSGGRIGIGADTVRAPHPSRAVVFQEAALFPWLNVWENIVFGPKAQRRPACEYAPLARELIAAVGLDGFEQSLPNQLSGGMKQRVGIARALIMRPKVLLMDEPFGALDAQTRLQMQELLLEVWERYRKTVIFITHDIDEAILLSDVIYTMSVRPGRIQRRIEVDLPRPRDASLLVDGAFNKVRREIFNSIRGH